MNDAIDALGGLGAAGGRGALPLANGELLFEAPWEARVFAMAHRLCDAGLFTWDEFRDALIAQIAHWEKTAAPGADYRYYECFQRALEALLATRRAAPTARLEARAAALAARPHGHDHHHDHHHDRDH